MNAMESMRKIPPLALRPSLGATGTGWAAPSGGESAVLDADVFLAGKLQVYQEPGTCVGAVNTCHPERSREPALSEPSEPKVILDVRLRNRFLV
jgi:hypothetical protein